MIRKHLLLGAESGPLEKGAYLPKKARFAESRRRRRRRRYVRPNSAQARKSRLEANYHAREREMGFSRNLKIPEI